MLRLTHLGMIGWQFNLMLMVVNLLPIPSLDGSRLVAHLLPSPLAEPYERLEPYGTLIFLGLIFSGLLEKIVDPIYRFLNVVMSQLLF